MLKYTVKKYFTEGSKINQIIMSVLMTLPVFSYGSGIGWLSPMAPRLMSGDNPSNVRVSEEVISWMASVAYLVGTPAVFLFRYVVDNHGRKRALILTSLSMAASWSLKLYSSETWALITARAIIGLGVSGSYVVTPLYIKEISDDSIRGMLGSLVILSQNLGNLTVYLLGEYLGYHAILWICLVVPLLHIVIFVGMPETPSYLLKCGKIEEAREVLAWLRCRPATHSAIDTELQNLMHEMETTRESSICAVLQTIVRERTTCRAFRITLTVTLARELCGCIAVLHYASLIFERAGGGTLSANQQAAVLGGVQLIGSCTASALVERTGRKPLLGATCLVSGVAMAALGVWFYQHEGAAGGPQPAWLPVVALCLCIFCDAGGLQPVPFVIMTEIFSFQLRGTVTSLVIAFACVLVSVQLRLFQPLVSAVGMYIVFWIFAGVCFASSLYVALYVPETKRKSLEEIYDQLDGGRAKGLEAEASVTRL